MSRLDAFKGRMRFLGRTDDLERERILVSAMRAGLLEQPDGAAGADLVQRMAETARSSRQEAIAAAGVAGDRRTGAATARAERRSALGSQLRLAGRLAGAVGAFVLAMAGLAVAGVTLPQPARHTFDRLGIHLPNQAGGGHDVSTGPGADTTGAPEGSQDSDNGSGSENGSGPDNASGEHGKSKAAHKRVRDARAKRLAAGHGRKLGYTKGKAIGLNEATPPGQTSSRPSGHYSAPANGGSNSSRSSHSRSNHRSSKGAPRGHVSGQSQSGAHRGK
jgi:hypothetical protein